jgi:hypothetical protein
MCQIVKSVFCIDVNVSRINGFTGFTDHTFGKVFCIDVIYGFTGFTDHTVGVAVSYVPAGSDYHAHGVASCKQLFLH